MLTHTLRRNLAGKLTSDSSADNLTTLDTLLNEADREILTLKPWPFAYKSRSFSTNTANVHFLPQDCGVVNTITVTIGTTKYTPYVVTTREEWDYLNQSTSTSNTPEYVYIFGNSFSFYPAPSSATTDAGTISFKRRQKDLSVADYTIGTISSIALAGVAVVGSGTTWTTQMAERYIRITDSNTTNTGDGQWYEIASVESTTALTLVAPYSGTAISGGSAAYTIGQVSIIPDEFQMGSVYRAVENYFSYIQPEQERATLAKNNYAEMVQRMKAELGSRTI